MLILDFLLYFISSFVFLTLIDCACYIPKIDEPGWVYYCDENYYNTYWEVKTICKAKNPSARVFMIRKDSTTTTPKVTTTTRATTTTKKSSNKKPPKKTKKTKKPKSTTTPKVTTTTTTQKIITTTIPSSAFDIGKLRNEYYYQTNKYRELHGVPKLKSSPTLEAAAQAYAEKLAKNYKGYLDHDSNKQYGENLATDYHGKQHNSVQRWYAESVKYDYNKPGYKPGIGHFTQLVWKSTTEQGCGFARATGIYSMFDIVVCKYYPRGNNLNLIAQNVLRPNK